MDWMVIPSSGFLSSEKASTLLLQLLPLGPGFDVLGRKSRPKVSPKKRPYCPGCISQIMPKSVPPTFHSSDVLLGLGNDSPCIGVPVTLAIRSTERIKNPHRLSMSSESSLEMFPSMYTALRIRRNSSGSVA